MQSDESEELARTFDDWDWRFHGSEKLYTRASMQWGGDAQMAKASEEFSELAAVCARDLNGQADQQELLEELVDARLMMEQIAQHITDEALDEMVEEKLEQLKQRLEGAQS